MPHAFCSSPAGFVTPLLWKRQKLAAWGAKPYMVPPDGVDFEELS
jgi:hypothetical protein